MQKGTLTQKVYVGVGVGEESKQQEKSLDTRTKFTLVSLAPSTQKSA